MRLGFLSCAVCVFFEFALIFRLTASESSLDTSVAGVSSGVLYRGRRSPKPESPGKSHLSITAPRKMPKRRLSKTVVADRGKKRRRNPQASQAAWPAESWTQLPESESHSPDIDTEMKRRKIGMHMDVDTLPPIIIPYDAAPSLLSFFPVPSDSSRVHHSQHFDRRRQDDDRYGRNGQRGPDRRGQDRLPFRDNRDPRPPMRNPNGFRNRPRYPPPMPLNNQRFPPPIPNHTSRQDRGPSHRDGLNDMRSPGPNNSRHLPRLPQRRPSPANPPMPPPGPRPRQVRPPFNPLPPAPRPPIPINQSGPPANFLPPPPRFEPQPARPPPPLSEIVHPLGPPPTVPEMVHPPLLPAPPPGPGPLLKPQPVNLPITSFPEKTGAVKASSNATEAEEGDDPDNNDHDCDEEDDEDCENGEEGSNATTSANISAGGDVHSSVYQTLPAGPALAGHKKPPVLPHLTTRQVAKTAASTTLAKVPSPTTTIRSTGTTKSHKKGGMKGGFDPSLGANTLREMGKEGETLRLACPLTQGLETQANHIIWTSPEKLVLKSGGRHVVQPVGGLIIHNLQSVDEGNYTCSLVTGKNIVSNGTVLVTIEDCAMSPCMNGGECEDLDGKGGAKLICRCPEAFKGRYCETKKNVWLLLIPIIGGGVVAVAVVAVIVRYSCFRNKSPKYQPLPQIPPENVPLQQVRTSLEPRRETVLQPVRRTVRPMTTTVVPQRVLSHIVPQHQERASQIVYTEPRRTVQMVPRYSQQVVPTQEIVYTEPVQYVVPAADVPVNGARPSQRFSQAPRMSWKYVDAAGAPAAVPMNEAVVQPEMQRMSVPVMRSSWHADGSGFPHHQQQIPVSAEVSSET